MDICKVYDVIVKKHITDETFWCTKCKTYKTIDQFTRRANKCKSCERNYNINHRNGKKDERKLYNKNYYINNIEKFSLSSKEYRDKNKKSIIDSNKAYYLKNFEKLAASKKEYRLKNLEKALASSRKHSVATAKYSAHAHKLVGIISCSENDDLLIPCTYCGELSTQPNYLIYNRIKAINTVNHGEHNLYCSIECKLACPTHWQQRHYKFQKIGHTREVPAEFRIMALSAKKHTCEKCGSTVKGLHVHHIEGYSESPMTVADLNNIVVCCINCHQKIHSIPGCTYVDYSCKNRRKK